MAAVVSLNGIDEAIKNLDYKGKDSPKLKLIQAIRAHYPDELALTSVQAIDPDTLVGAVWETVLDENRLRSRRKNLASIRSSVNQDLKLLFEDGKNPEGIVIGPSYTFVMSDEAKDQMLTSVAASVRKDGPVSLGQITRTLSVIEDLLAHAEKLSTAGEDDRESGIRRLKQIITQISKRIDLDTGDGPTQDETSGGSGPRPYPDERRGSDQGHGRPGDGGTGHANSEFGSGDSGWPGIGGVSPAGVEGAPGSSGGSDGNRIGAPRDGSGGAGSDLDEGDLSGEYGAPSSGGAADGDLVPEEIPAEQDAFEEVEIVDEPEDLAVVDESQVEGPDGAAGSDEPETDREDAPFEAEVERSGQGLKKESGGELGLGAEGSQGATRSSTDGRSDENREAMEGTEGAPDGEWGGAELSGIDGKEVGLGNEEMGDGPGGAITEGIQDADFLQEEIVGDEEEDIEEMVEDGPPDEDHIPVAETGSGDLGLDIDVMADEKGRSHQTAGKEAGEGFPPDPDGQEEFDELDLDEVIEEEDDSDMEAPDEVRLAGSGNEVGLGSGAGSGQNTEPLGNGQGMDPSAPPDMGLPLGSLGLDPFEDAYQTPGNAQGTDHKLLAETFDGYLGAMERFYNQYLLIPKGAYTVGGGPIVEGLAESRARLPAFYMGKFPVTNALFEIFVEKTGYRTTAEREGYGVVYYARRKKAMDPKTGKERIIWNSALASQRVDGACWYQPLGPGSTLHHKRNHPVVQVSLEDAYAFAAWTGKRLPSEAEWEAASRSRNGHLYPWGDAWQDDCCNVEETQAGDTTPVDAYVEAACPFGIADTLGNVMEWTLDRDQIDEKAGRPCYIVKGGSWASTSDICLCSRFKMMPDARSNILGFRCVAS